MHWIYLIHEFHNLSWITEINELFHDILIYWDAPVYIYIAYEQQKAGYVMYPPMFKVSERINSAFGSKIIGNFQGISVAIAVLWT